MVDALLSAAAESDGSPLDGIMMSGINDQFIREREAPLPPLRFCEFCNSSNTPTWRRGPAGKGSLCNACGIKWRLRKRLKKNEKSDSPSPTPTVPDRKVSPLVVKPPKKRKDPDQPARSPTKSKDKDALAEYLPPSLSSHSGGGKRKKYYCKYCDQTFSLSQFRNSQQFGAHCSNCSRRPRDEEGGFYDFDNDSHYRYDRYSPYGSPSPGDRLSSPGTPESPIPSNRDGLLLRLLHVVEHQLVDVHELAEIRDELSSLKTELISREETMKAELGMMRVRVKEDLAELKTGLKRTVAAHEQLAAHRLMEMEQTIRSRTSGESVTF